MGKIKQDRTCLLVTGTVVPNSNFVAHADVEKRLQEYYEGLSFYASVFPSLPVYFLENSSYDFSANPDFQKLFIEKKITLVKFPVSDKFNQGKGYQEFEMLDKTIEQLSGTFDSFVKITGRYKVLNLPRLIRSVSKDLLADSHKKHRVTQTNVFYVSGNFYLRHLKDLYLLADDSKGIFIEKVVYEKLVRDKLFDKAGLFPVNPVIIGTSGSYGGSLGRNKLKMKVRNAERVLLRLFGIKQFLIEY